MLKFFVAGVTFYGMATFEGPLLSIKSVSGLAHYTDWIIGHVHTGALGWNGFMAAGMFYFLVPRLWGRALHSKAAADVHFWVGTLGILLYTVSMWVSGVTQGLMWKATNPDGTLLYPSFVETLIAIRPMYYTRIVGGALYLVGYIIMIWNLTATIMAGSPVESSVQVIEPDRKPEMPWQKLLFSQPVILATVAVLMMVIFFLSDQVEIAVLMLTILIVLVVVAWLSFALSRELTASQPASRARRTSAAVYGTDAGGGLDWRRCRAPANHPRRPRGAQDRRHRNALSPARSSRS